MEIIIETDSSVENTTVCSLQYMNPNDPDCTAFCGPVGDDY